MKSKRHLLDDRISTSRLAPPLPLRRPGVYANYVELHGWDEFRPVTGGTP